MHEWIQNDLPMSCIFSCTKKNEESIETNGVYFIPRYAIGDMQNIPSVLVVSTDPGKVFSTIAISTVKRFKSLYAWMETDGYAKYIQCAYLSKINNSKYFFLHRINVISKD